MWYCGHFNSWIVVLDVELNVTCGIHTLDEVFLLYISDLHFQPPILEQFWWMFRHHYTGRRIKVFCAGNLYRHATEIKNSIWNIYFETSWQEKNCQYIGSDISYVITCWNSIRTISALASLVAATKCTHTNWWNSFLDILWRIARKSKRLKY